MLYASLHPTVPHQGDILDNCYFPALDLDIPKIVDSSVSGNEIKEPPVSITSSTETLKLVTNFKKNLGMIITQTCNAQRRDFIQICPVYSISSLQKALAESLAEDKVNNQLGQLRNGKLGYYFYLPEVTLDGYHLEESYVDLQLVTNVRQGGLSNYPRLIALSDMGRHWISFALMSYYGRPFSE